MREASSILVAQKKPISARAPLLPCGPVPRSCSGLPVSGSFWRFPVGYAPAARFCRCGFPSIFRCRIPAPAFFPALPTFTAETAFSFLGVHLRLSTIPARWTTLAHRARFPASPIYLFICLFILEASLVSPRAVCPALNISTKPVEKAPVPAYPKLHLSPICSACH